MNIYLVHPRSMHTFVGWDDSCRMVGKRFYSPPLSITTVAGLTPPEHTVELCDEHVQRIRWDTDADLVGVTGTHVQRDRMVEIARRFRARGKPVVIGGPSATAVPDWYRSAADVLILGEAEHVWPKFLRDFAAGCWQAAYQETGQVDLKESPPPRYDLLRIRDYMKIGMQTTRGCPFTCEFCDIITLFGRTVRMKGVDQVLTELEQLLSLGVRNVFFVDDNFIGNRPHVVRLLEALRRVVRRLKRPPRFSCQATVNLANDPAILQLMHDIGMCDVFIGIETPRKASLQETKKYQNAVADLADAVEAIQSYGIGVTSGLMVGFDHDDRTIFQEQEAFIARAKIPFCLPYQLVALPGTPLHARMQREGRLSDTPETADEAFGGTNVMGGTNIIPKLMSRQELRDGFVMMVRRLYVPEAFADRVLGELERVQRMPPSRRANRLPGPLLWLAYAWVWLWFLCDRHPGPLLRLFWRVTGRVVTRHQPVAELALARMIFYRHLHRRLHQPSWQPRPTPAFGARQISGDTLTMQQRLHARQPVPPETPAPEPSLVNG